MRKILLVLAAFIFFKAQAQTPIQVNAQLLPPYSLQVSDYYSPTATGGQKLNLILLNRDFLRSTINVRLRMVIESQGVRIATREDVTWPTVTLISGTPYYVTPAELASYFNPNNLIFSGISQEQYTTTGKLPEGFYTFCFETVEPATGLTVSNKGCAFAWMTMSDPPFLNIPAKAETVTPNASQNINFQWTPRHSASPNAGFSTDYVFTITEVMANDFSPESAFTSHQALYTDSTQATMYNYGPAKPLLIAGRKYAWRVQAKAKQGFDNLAMFRNFGYSEVFWFDYKNNCTPPLGITATVQGTRVTITWQVQPIYLGYKVEYREKNNATAEWFTITTIDPTVVINDLNFSKEYEYRVGASCEEGAFNYSNLLAFTTGAVAVPVIANCGDSSGIPNTVAQTYLASMPVGDTIKAGDFKVKIVTISGSTSFTGTGTVKIPWLLGVKAQVKFTGIKVNTLKQLAVGKIETTYDPKEAGILDVDDVIDIFCAGCNVGNVITGAAGADTTVGFPILWPGGITASVGPTYNPPTVNGPATITITGVGGTPVITIVAQTLPKTIMDSTGNIYQVNNTKPVTVTLIGKAGGAAWLAKTNKALIDADKAIVKFVTYTDSATKVKYAFDEWNPLYKKSGTFNKEYEKISCAGGGDCIDGGAYYVSAKAIAPGKTDYLKVMVTKVDNTINPDSIQFVNGKGIIYSKKRLATAATIYNYEIAVVGGPEKDAQEIYALYPRTGSKTFNLGKVLVASYPRKDYNIKLVPDSGIVINSATYSDSVNRIYNKLNVFINFVADNNLPNRSWDLEKDGKLETTSTNLFTSYSAEMNALITLLKSTRVVEQNTFYLFVLNDAKELNVIGDMPLGKKYGFIFKNQTLTKQTRTVAHEIGHGLFALKHPFDGASYLVTDPLNNLMMYGDDRTLCKSQWDLVHDPSLFAGILKDEAGAKELSVNVSALSAFKKILPFEHFTFITPSGRPISIPADKLTKVNFSTSDILVNSDDNSLSSLVPIGSLYSFTYDNILYEYRGTKFAKIPSQVRLASEGLTNQRFDYYKGGGKIYIDELVKRQGATYVRTTYLNLADTSLYRYAIFGLPFVNVRTDDDLKIRIIKARSLYSISTEEESANGYRASGLVMGMTRLCTQQQFAIYNTQAVTEIPSGISIKNSNRFNERAQDFIASLNAYTNQFNSLAPLIIAHAQKITEFPDASLCIEQAEAEQFLATITGEEYEAIKSKSITEIENQYMEPNRVDLNYSLAQNSLFGYINIDKNNTELRNTIKGNNIDAIINLIVQEKITICNLRNLTGDELMGVLNMLIPKTNISIGKRAFNKVFEATIKNGYVERVNVKLTENNNLIAATLYDNFRKNDIAEFASFSLNMLTMFQFLNPNYKTSPFTFSLKMSDKENTIFTNYPKDLVVSNGAINSYNYEASYPSGNLAFNGTLVDYTLMMNGVTYKNYLSICKQFWSSQRTDALQRYYHASPFDLVELDFNVSDAWYITDDLVNKKITVPMFYAAFVIESKMDEISKRNTRQCMALGLIAATVVTGGATTVLGGITVGVSAIDFIVSENYDQLSNSGYNAAINDWEEISNTVMTVSAIAELGTGVIIMGPKVLVGAKNIFTYVKINTGALLTKMPTLSRSTRLQILGAFEKIRMHSLRFANITQRTLYESMFRLQLLFKVQAKNLIAATEQVVGKTISIEVRNGTEIFLKEGNMVSHVKIGELAMDANGTYIANIRTLPTEAGAAEKIGTVKDFRYQANGTAVKPAKELGVYRIGNEIAFVNEGRWMDDIFNTQKNVVNQNKNSIATASNNSKGAFGEIGSDVVLTEREFQALHRRKTALTDGWGETGIDGVFKKNDQFYIVEAKYGSSTLSNTASGKQMSDTWILGDDRLLNAVGASTRQEIIAVGYKRLLAKISADGSVVYKELDALGIEIGTFIP
jgi:hypothetical protein